MFLLDRQAIYLFRTALRLCYDGPAKGIGLIPVLIRHGKTGLLMHACHQDFAVMYSQAGQACKGALALPASALALVEGRGQDQVELDALSSDKGTARWLERAGPRQSEFQILDPKSVAAPPTLPKTFEPMPREFLEAVNEASRCAARSPTKYVLNRIKLSGKKGEVIGTDSRQLFIQGGFKFPFSEDLLIPRSGVFGLPAFQEMEEISLGRTDTHVAFGAGRWIFAFRIDAEGRFPDAGSVVPRSSAATMRFHLDPADAQFFLDNLGKRIKGPHAKDEELAVTLDLNEQPCFRFKLDSQIMELPLSRSEARGKSVRMCVDLKQFLRALELKLMDFEIRDADKPLVARDGQRIYVAMPKSSDAALAPDVNAVRLSPWTQPVEAVPATTNPGSQQETAPVATAEAPQAMVPVTSDVPALSDVQPFDLFAEAESLHGAVVDAAEHAGRILALPETESFRCAAIKAAEHAGRILRFLREVCTKSQVKQIVRTSLQALSNKSP